MKNAWLVDDPIKDFDHLIGKIWCRLNRIKIGRGRWADYVQTPDIEGFCEICLW